MLGVGGLWNAELKKKWYEYLSWLDTIESDTPRISSGQAIVALLVRHLRNEQPLPVYFKAHDMRDHALGIKVVVSHEPAVFYLDQKYLTISLPMAPRDPGKRGAVKRARK